MIYTKLEYPMIILSTKYHKHLGRLVTVDESSIQINQNMNSAQEISFTVHKKFDNKEEPLWDQIVDFKYVYVPEFNEYFNIFVTIDDADETVKQVVGTSACEFELSKRILYDFECNTEDDIAREDYSPTVLYNEDDHNASLIHRVLHDKCPDYSVGHVDDSIARIQRTFSTNGTSIYDFLTGTVAEEIECLFKFDSVNRVVNCYDLKFVCDSCGHRGDFASACPKCGSTEYHSNYGQITDIYISAENYAESISRSGDTDNVYNCLRISGGDDDVTTAFMYVNPNGSRYLYSFNEHMLSDMPEELVQKIHDYNVLYEDNIVKYQEASTQYYEAVDRKNYLEHTMMPKVTTPTTDAKKEADELPGDFLEFGSVCVTNIDSISTISADLAVQGLARVLVDARYDVKAKGELATVDTNNKRWTGVCTITNYGDDEDTAQTEQFSVLIQGGTDTAYAKYLYQRILKQLDRDDNTFYDLFTLTDVEIFKEELTKYSKARLESFYHSYETCLNVMIENGVTDKNSDFYGVHLYETMYEPYKERMDLIVDELAVRDADIAEQDELITSARETINGFHNLLDFKSFIGDDLWLIFSHYLVESEYTNDNYVSDGLDNKQLLDKARELYDVAAKEVVKASTEQYTLSATMNNLLQEKGFAPYVDQVQLGNWIVVRSDEELFNLRIIAISIDYGNLASIGITFSNADRINNTINDAKSILDQVKSMASSYNTVAHQANQGDEANENVTDWKNMGLDGTLVAIKNNNNEEVLFDNNGILLRSWDDIAGKYSQSQAKLTHNVFAFTDDNWKTCALGIGEGDYIKYDPVEDKFITKRGYGLISKFVTAGCVNGSMIIGGQIYSNNYSHKNKTGSYLDLENGKFSLAGGKLTFDGHEFINNGSLTVKDANEEIVFKADVDNRIVQVGGFTATSDALYHGTDSLTSTNLGVFIGVDGDNVGLRNYKDATHSVTISNGTLTANNVAITGGSLNINNKFVVNASGVLTATSANFSGAITGSSFTASGSITKYARDYSEADVTRMREIMVGISEPSSSDYEKYDLNQDGLIDAHDLVSVRRFIDGIDTSRTINTSIVINPLTHSNIIETDGVYIRSNGIYAKSIQTENLQMHSFKMYDPSSGNIRPGMDGTWSNITKIRIVGGVIMSVIGTREDV